MRISNLHSWCGRVSVLLLLLTGCTLTTALAQNLTVRGKITSETGDALPGVTVVLKGTSTGTVSDANGNYSLANATQNGTLGISYVGYQPKDVPINGRSTINISLTPDAKALEEVVVVGYGTQKKTTVTGAVVAVQGEKLIQSPAVDLGNSLAGRLPGLVVINTTGEPGQDGAQINIRGINTLGNSSPLIVIDGIPDRDGGLGRLAPRDIESISVLKDASAAIYGARAANGAIIITTKRGKSGKPTVTYDFNQGWSQPAVIPKMSSAVEYANIMNELPIYKTIPPSEWQAASAAIRSTGTYNSPTPGVSAINANYSPDAVRKYADGSDPWGYPNTNWFGDAFKKWAPQSRHNVQIVGGSDNIRYMASLGYVHQDAIYKNSATFYNQYNLRVNVDAKVSDYIKANVGVMLRREDRNYPTESAGAIFRMLMRGRPVEPEVWPNGQPGPDIENGQNPYVITTNATGYNRNPKDFIQTNGGLEITNPWVKGLKLTLNASVDKTSETNKIWQTPWMLYSWDRITYEADGKTPKLVGAIRSNFTDPRLTQSYRNVLNTNLTALLNYERELAGGHSLNFLAGVTKEQFQGEYFSAFRRNYISPAIDQLFAGGSLQQNTDGSAYNRARLGYYGRAQYAYKQKYLAEFIWRYDGSYIFPAARRFGFFPGVLLGYTISNEKFFHVPGVDYLKLRASYGQMGNDQVYYNNQLQEYAFLSAYGFGQYPINSVVATTLQETVLANPSFTWERAKNYNVGMDATFLNNRFDLTLEYFHNRRDQILIQKTGSTPSSSGISSLLPPTNAGIVTNRGFEFSLNYNAKANGPLRFRAGINGGYARNKVVFMDEIPGAPDWQRQEGKPIGAYLVYQSDGAFKDQAAITENKIDYSGVTGKLLPGDLRIRDYNGDGKITADDAVRINKNITPTFNFGATAEIRYKNFDLNLLFQGATGAAFFIQTESGDIGNYLKWSYDHRWSIDNPSDRYPRLASRGDTYYTGGNFGNNTNFLFSKDYIRLKNIELGYALPDELVQRLHLNRVRVFVNGLNVFTFAAQNIFDPETINGSGQVYPQSRVINTGVTVSF
jgi:TonB-linked SusC/RagA family outer membrane protein